MAKNTKTVDYPTDVIGAEKFAKTAARSWKAWAGQEASKTEVAVHATRAALHTGYLADGRDPERDPRSRTKAEFASLFDVTPSYVTFWMTLATALDHGVAVGTDLWSILCGKKLARRKNIAAAVEKGPDAIVKALAADGFDPVTGNKVPTESAPRNVDKGSKSKGESPEQGIPTSEDPVADALLAILGLGEACKRIPVEDTSGWDKVRKAVTEVMRRETTLRKPKGATVKAAKAA